MTSEIINTKAGSTICLALRSYVQGTTHPPNKNHMQIVSHITFPPSESLTLSLNAFHGPY